MNVKHPIIIKGNANKEPHLKGTYNFENHLRGLNRIVSICKLCKHFDEKTDFPNSFCDEACEGIDYWFCLGQCPLGKWKIVDPKETVDK